MSANTAATSLRQTDRKRLLGHLLKLSDGDPAQRAKAALAATELLQRKGLSWASLVPTGPGEASNGSLVRDWKAQALDLANCADLTPAERAIVLKVAGWKSPGADGLERLREIAERVGVNLR